MEQSVVRFGEYERKEQEAVHQIQRLLASGEKISIKKNNKHIFKQRDRRPNLDLRHFNQIVDVDTERQIATVEGMTSFYDLVGATLSLGFMPQAVPELRAITVGGAIAGLGGQSSSFKFGLVHEMITEFDLLTGQGKIVHCSADTNSDLFFMLPNSYGSLGYVLKCAIKLNPVQSYVRLEYRRFSEMEPFFGAMFEEVQAGGVDFIEGVSFSPEEYVLLLGTFSDGPPPGKKVLRPLHTPFFHSVRDPAVFTEYLTIRDYIWRWDPDAFWATNQQNMIGNLLLNPLFRHTLGSMFLRSDRLIKIGKLRNRMRKAGVARFLFLEEKRMEALIQDAAIPFSNAPRFNAWLADELGIFPLWYCPVKSTRPLGTYPLYQPESEFVLDFGFYVSMELDEREGDFHYNRQIEEKLVEMGGLKCLYSDTFYEPEIFWNIYDRDRYFQVKEKYDPQHAFLDLYHKVVNGPV